MKILFSGFADSNHSANGGYDKIINIPLPKRVLLRDMYLFGKINKKYHLSKIPLWIMDFHTRILRYKFDITHLFYGEISMCPFFKYSRSKKHKTVITLHLDIEKQNLHTFLIDKLPYFDGIIVLSSQQKKYYKEKYGINTTFIPHGFDKPVFKEILPKDKCQRSIDLSKINLIVIGKNYRDFETLEKLIKHTIHNTNIHFHIVGVPSEIKDRLGVSVSNVSIYNRLSDDEYYTLISKCDYHFLPLSFATANNSLMEAQSLGIRSILPKIDGISDYAAPEPMNIFYHDFEELKDISDSITKSQSNNDIIEYSKKFQWNNIYKELEIYYKKL